MERIEFRGDYIPERDSVCRCAARTLREVVTEEILANPRWSPHCPVAFSNWFAWPGDHDVKKTLGSTISALQLPMMRLIEGPYGFGFEAFMSAGV